MGGLPLSLMLSRTTRSFCRDTACPNLCTHRKQKCFIPFQPHIPCNLSLGSYSKGEAYQTLLPSLVLFYPFLPLLDQLLAAALSSGFCSSAGREESHLYYTSGCCSLALKYRQKITFLNNG